MAIPIMVPVLSVFIIVTMEQSSATTSSSKNLSASCNDFTKAFYNEVCSTDAGNIVISPLNIHMILSYLSHGAESDTLDELVKGLCHDNQDTIKEGYMSLITKLNELKNIKLYIANTMYIQNDFKLLSEFLTLGKEVYQSEISKVDFKHNVNAANIINTWIKEKTNNKISNIVSSDDFDKETRLVLVTAIYFNGNWLNAFNARSTQNRMFHVTSNQTKLVPTMYRKAQYNHGSIPKLHAKFIEIPYRDEDVVLTIVLPDEIDGLSNLQNNFSWKLLTTATKNHNEVELYLPKFKIEFALNLKHILQKLGVNAMFEHNANFTLISDVPLVVNKILHKAVINVNEEGTEAGAATAVQMRLRRMIDAEEPEEFLVDRPFMFIIEYKPDSIPLFIGSVKDIEFTLQKDEL